MTKYIFDVTSFSSFSKNEPKQIIILCHGYGGDGQDISALALNWRRFLPDAVFLCPNAPEVCTVNPLGYQWFDMAVENDETILEKSLVAEKKLNTFLDQVLDDFQLDIINLALVGFSQGSMIGLSEKLLHNYVDYIAAKRMKAIGIPVKNEIKQNPLPWTQSWISSKTFEKVKHHLQQGNQVLFFLNRRGFSPYVLCKNCLKVYSCPDCSINLVYHKNKKNLLCHYCGFKTDLKRECKRNISASCKFVFSGPGVEKISEELFPKMAEKVKTTGVSKASGYLYYLGKDGNVWRSQMSRGGSGGGNAEKVADAGVTRESGYLYFIDKDGDVSRAPMARGRG